MPTFTAKYTKDDLVRLIREDIERRFSVSQITSSKVIIETKSTQNYRSEWENADYRASIEFDNR
jgi:hypothetical protein